MPLRSPLSFEQQPFSDLPSKSLHFWIDWLQWAPVGLGCALYLQGKPSPSTLLLFSCCIPVLRFLVAPTYRRRVLDRLRTLRNSLESYPFRSAPAPWAGVLVWVVLPA